jgi:hypothetical protein
MSETLQTIKQLVSDGNIRISEHGYDEAAEGAIFIKDIISSVHKASVVEDYPKFPKGAAVLMLQFDGEECPVHVVWGIPKGFTSPAVVVTAYPAYRPDPDRWNNSFTQRKG